MIRTSRQYAKAIRRMMERARQWRAVRPGVVIEVQFNWPPHVEMIAPISEALEEKLVTANQAGRELIEHIGNFNKPHEATVAMIRAALEGEMPSLYKDAQQQGIKSVELTKAGRLKVK